MGITVIDILLALSLITINILVAFLLIRGRENKSSKYLVYGSLGAAVWILANFIFRHYSNDLMIFVVKTEYIVGVFIFTNFLFFTRTFLSTSLKRNSKLFIVASSLFALFVILVLFTDSIISGMGAGKSYEMGNLYWLYLVYMAFLAISAFYYLVAKFISVRKPSSKKQIIYIIIGAGIAFMVGIIADIILPMMGNFSVLWLGPVATTAFVASISYLIFRHRLFDIKIITTELLIFVVLTIAFVEIVITTNLTTLLLKIAFFLILSLFSVYALRGIYKEAEQRKKIEQLAQRLSEFVSFTTHELRTPVAKLRALTATMLEDKSKHTQKEIRKWLECTSEIATEMNQDIEMFLNLNKMETGELELVKQEMDICEIISKSLQDFKSRIKTKSIKVNFIKNGNIPEVKADKFKIYHVVSNLINNAIKFTPKGGSLDIEVKVDGSNLVCIFKDSGVGISSEVLPLLFKRYERGSKKTKKLFRGSGIGLFLSKKLIEMHGGRIWAESDGEDKGSTFSFSLPI